MAKPNEPIKPDGTRKRAMYVTGQQPQRAGGATGKKAAKKAAHVESAAYLVRLKLHHPEQYERLMRERAEREGQRPDGDS